jgi:hypothetical protein
MKGRVMDTAVIVALVCVALVIVFIAWVRINSDPENKSTRENRREGDKTR